MVRKLPIVTMRVGVSVEDSDDPSRKVTASSSNPRERKWIDLPLDSDCLLQVELKRRTLDRAKVSSGTNIRVRNLNVKFCCALFTLSYTVYLLHTE